MELLGLNELQWLVISITCSGIFFNIGMYVGISNTFDYFNKDD